MEFTIVGGYHNGKKICMSEPKPVGLCEDFELPIGSEIAENMTVNLHEYVPQSFDLSFYGKKFYVLVPVGQSIPDTLSILISEHGVAL